MYICKLKGILVNELTSKKVDELILLSVKKIF